MSDNFNEVTGGETPGLVGFLLHATSVQAVKMMGPVLAELKQRFGDRLRIIKLISTIRPTRKASVGTEYVPSLR